MAIDCRMWRLKNITKWMFDFLYVLKSAVQGIQTEKLELQDFAYVFFGNLSTVAKERFSPFLEAIVPHLIDVINEVDTVPVFDDDAEKQFNGLHDSEDEDDEGDVPLGLHFRVEI